ncbi:MAG: hypothetical protein R6U86_02875 [Bacteroidales bacterium]
MKPQKPTETERALPFVRMLAFMGLALLFFSCASERRLASRFVVRESNINLLLLPPSGLLKSFSPVHPSEIPEDEPFFFDPAESRFLEALNDSAFVDYYMRSLTYHLSQLQINVYGPEALDRFLGLDSTAFIFSMAQVELLEFNDYFTEFTAIDTMNYRVDLPRTNLELSTWFEFTEVNHSERPVEVLFSMQNTSDYFDGRFVYNMFSGEVSYRKTTYPLEVPDVYDLAYFAGQKNAGYIFDHLMNLYVHDKRKANVPSRIYYQYDSERHAIRRAYNDRFIRIPASPADPVSDELEALKELKDSL